MASRESLADTLLSCMFKMGMRGKNVPEKDVFSALVHHVVKNYGGHTCQEIVLAFDMALTGKLDLEANQIPCYENFSCLYFSTIMNSYRRWAAQEYRQMEGSQSVILLEGPKESLTDEAMQEWLNHVILGVTGGHLAIEFLPLQLYEWLEKKGTLMVGPAEKWEYVGKAVHRRQDFLVYTDNQNSTVESQRDLSAFLLMRKDGCFKGAEVDHLKNLAKRILLWEHITGTAYEIA